MQDVLSRRFRDVFPKPRTYFPYDFTDLGPGPTPLPRTFPSGAPPVKLSYAICNNFICNATCRRLCRKISYVFKNAGKYPTGNMSRREPAGTCIYKSPFTSMQSNVRKSPMKLRNVQLYVTSHIIIFPKNNSADHFCAFISDSRR